MTPSTSRSMVFVWALAALVLTPGHDLHAQTELAMGPDGGKLHEVAKGFFPDDLHQSPEFDPTDPEPIPQDDFDQSWGA